MLEGQGTLRRTHPGPAGRGNVVVIPRIPQHDPVLAGPGEAAQSTFPAGKGNSTSAIQEHSTDPAIKPPGEMEVRSEATPRSGSMKVGKNPLAYILLLLEIFHK